MDGSEWEMDEKLKGLVDTFLERSRDTNLALDAGIMAIFGLVLGFAYLITVYHDSQEAREATKAFIMNLKETPLDPAILEALESLVTKMCDDRTIFQISKESYPEERT